MKDDHDYPFLKPDHTARNIFGFALAATLMLFVYTFWLYPEDPHTPTILHVGIAAILTGIMGGFWLAIARM